MNVSTTLQDQSAPTADKQRGFTLLELVIGIAILAILTMIAVPAMNEFVINSRSSRQTNQLLADLALARSEALATGSSVRISAPISWETGWEVATDRNRNSVLDGADERLSVHDGLAVDFELTVSDAANGERSEFWFSALGGGMTEAPAVGVAVVFPVRLLLKRPDNDADKASTICVSASGTATSKKGTLAC